jgi:hypothetical protein
VSCYRPIGLQYKTVCYLVKLWKRTSWRSFCSKAIHCRVVTAGINIVGCWSQQNAVVYRRSSLYVVVAPSLCLQGCKPGTRNFPTSSTRLCFLTPTTASWRFWNYPLILKLVIGVSACIATRLKAGRSGVRVPVGEKDFSLQNVQAGCGAHPAFCSVGIGVLSWGKAVESGYNDIGLSDTSHIASDMLWHQLIPHRQT